MSASETVTVEDARDPAVRNIMVSEAGQAEGCYFQGIH
jgi:hypothetical protein